MTRFVMTVDQAARVVLSSADRAKGGEIFISKMPAVRIVDLIDVMINYVEKANGHDAGEIEVTEIGLRPGEKLYEELMSEEEVRRSMLCGDYFVVLPAFRGLYRDLSYDYDENLIGMIEKPYTSASEPAMDKKELSKLLIENDLLDEELEQVKSWNSHWPGEDD